MFSIETESKNVSLRNVANGRRYFYILSPNVVQQRQHSKNAKVETRVTVGIFETSNTSHRLFYCGLMRLAVPLSSHFPISDAAETRVTTAFTTSLRNIQLSPFFSFPADSNDPSLENFPLVFHDISNEHNRKTSAPSLFIRKIIDSFQGFLLNEGREECRESRNLISQVGDRFRTRRYCVERRRNYRDTFGKKFPSSSFVCIYIYMYSVCTHTEQRYTVSFPPCLNGANRNGNNTPCLGQVSSPLSGLSLETPEFREEEEGRF